MTNRFFNPPEIRILVRERAYYPGETINATIEIRSESELEVREGRIKLIWEEEFDHEFEMSVVNPTKLRQRMPMLGSISGPDITDYLNPGPESKTKIPITNTVVFTYVHRNRAFTKNSKLRSGRTSFPIKLSLRSKVPRTKKDSKLICKLVASLDIPLGRDAKQEQIVNVATS